MAQAVIAAFKKSLSSSYFGVLRVWSTPTVPNHGVAGLYDQSDKKRWFYKCSHCNHWQYLTRANIAQKAGPTSLVQRLEAHDRAARIGDGFFDTVCIKCRKPITRMTEACEWIAEDPTATEYSGYAISQLDAAWITTDDIMRSLRDDGPGLYPFYTYTLGQEYAGDAGTITEGWLHTLVNPEIPSCDGRNYFDTKCTNLRIGIGIDWGKTNWLVVLATCNEWSRPVILAWYKFVDTANPADTWRWAVKIAQDWNADGVVADVGYGQDRNPHLYMALGNVFYGCQYRTTAGKQVQKPATSVPAFGPSPPPPTDSHPVVSIDRTSSVKEQLLTLRNSGYAIARLTEEEVEELDYHSRNIAITTENMPDGTPVETAVDTGPDHLLHALNYAAIALVWAGRRNIRMGMVTVDAQDMYGQSIANDIGKQIITGSDVEDMYELYGSILGDDLLY